MTASPLPWDDWYRDELAELRTLIDDIPHPAGRAVACELLTDLEQAAYDGRVVRHFA